MPEYDDRWLDLGAFIRDQRRVGQLSLRKLSEMAGISNPYLSQIERGLRKPSAEILRQIAQALHISAETLYVRAGILDEPDGEVDLVAEIGRDPWLDEEQKKTLVHIYESFRAERQAQADAHLAATDPDGADPDERDPDERDPDEPAPDGPSPDEVVGPDAPTSSAGPDAAAAEPDATAGEPGPGNPRTDVPPVDAHGELAEVERGRPAGDVAPAR